MIHTYSTTWKSESHELIRVVIGTSLTTFDVAKLLKFLIAAYIFPCCGFGPVLDRIWIWPLYNQGPDHLFSSWNGVDKIFIYVYMMYLFFKKKCQGKDVKRGVRSGSGSRVGFWTWYGQTPDPQHCTAPFYFWDFCHSTFEHDLFLPFVSLFLSAV